MTMRQWLIDNGADKNYVAQGLAGVATEEAERFRKEVLVEPTLIARSYSTGWTELDAVVCRY